MVKMDLFASENELEVILPQKHSLSTGDAKISFKDIINDNFSDILLGEHISKSGVGFIGINERVFYGRKFFNDINETFVNVGDTEL